MFDVVVWSPAYKLNADNIDKIPSNQIGVYLLAHTSGEDGNYIAQPYRTGKATDLHDRLLQHLNPTESHFDQKSLQCLEKHITAPDDRWFCISLLPAHLAGSKDAEAWNSLLESNAENQFGGKRLIECNLIAAPNPLKQQKIAKLTSFEQIGDLYK
jgi:hypothetical protein